MKRIPLLLLVALVCVGLAACGGSGKGATTASNATATVAPTTAGAGSARKAPLPIYTPTAADKLKVEAVVKRYYAAALAGDAAAGCSMLYSSLAKAVVEDYAQADGPSYLRGAKTCTQLLSKAFSHFHGQLAAAVPTLKVIAVRLDGEHAGAMVSFKGMATLEVPVQLDRDGWKVDQIVAFRPTTGSIR